MKSTSVAFLFWLGCLSGLCGLHRFYVGRYLSGLIWLFTFGLFGIGQFFDLFLLGSMVRQANILSMWGRPMNQNINTNTVAPVINITVSKEMS